MKLMVFDTETTALRPGQICQLSYIIDDGGELSACNRYFSVDEMSESSYAVHGLSREALEMLSGGLSFRDCAEKLYDVFSSADIVAGHNVAADLRFLQTEFERAGLELPEIKSFCTMNHFTKVMKLERRYPAGYPKPPKLIELAEFLGVKQESARELCAKLFGKGSELHDARFDTALTYLCIKVGIGRGYIKL